MANNPSDLIQFKRGAMSALQTKITNKTGEDGCFYLTIDNDIDSSRLFVGRADGSIVPVNQGIVTVANTSDLSSLAGNFQAGDFAYVTNGNILAVRSGNSWVQINNAVDTYVNDFTDTITVSNGIATITSTVSQNGQTDISSAFTVAGDNGITISSTAGTGGAADLLTIEGEKYEISRGAASSNAATITLASDKQDSAAHDRDSSISIKGGNNVTIATPNAGEIQISAEDHYVADANFVGKTANGFELTIEQDDLSDVTAALDPQIKVGIDSTKQQTIHFVGDGSANSALATLPVYTQAEIDDKLIGINAMVYKGTVGTNGSAATAVSGITDVSIGDTFKASSDLSAIPILSNGSIATGVNGGTAKAGDLLIANSTAAENANGKIASGLYFDIIPSGDDINDYIIEAATHGFTLEEGSANKGGFFLAEGTQISLADSLNGQDRVVTVSHRTVDRSDPVATTAAQTNGNDLVVTVVDGVTSDAQGHVTAVNTKQITVKDSVASVSTVDSGVTATNNVATITTTVGVTPYPNANESSSNDAFTVASDNLTITAPTASQVKMNFVWGTF